MVNYSILCDFDAVSSLVHCAEKEFLDECGNDGPYYLQTEKDYFRACMNVVSYIVSDLFPGDCINYFDSLCESRYKYYFGGNESE